MFLIYGRTDICNYRVASSLKNLLLHKQYIMFNLLLKLNLVTLIAFIFGAISVIIVEHYIPFYFFKGKSVCFLVFDA